MSEPALIEADKLVVRYRTVTALDALSLSVERGERIALLGANGSGKSTLLRVFNALLFPDSGSLRVAGEAIERRSFEDLEFTFRFRRRVGLVFQNPDLQLFNPTVFDEVAFGPLQLQWPKNELRERVREALVALGAAHLENRSPHQLSGGEKKRVALASVLILNPEVLLLDEPTGALDPRTQSEIVNLLRSWRGGTKTVITATHDLDNLEEIADRAVVLANGQIVGQGTPFDILHDISLLQHARLIAAHRHSHPGGVKQPHPHVHLDATSKMTNHAQTVNDDELLRFEAEGAPALPAGEGRYLDHDGARIWYASYGSGPPVVLLHGGLGHSGNWGGQIPALLAHGYRVVVIDSRGHGRSTRDERPYRYERMAGDVLAVLDALTLETAALVGWSDGACIAMELAAAAPERVSGVFFFACNMDPSGTKPLEDSPVLQRCFRRHVIDYARLSAKPAEFKTLLEDVGLMQRTQPNYSAEQLAAIGVPVTVAQSQRDEFIRREHAEYIARTVPAAEFVLLENVSHFAPLQRPDQFNFAVLTFLHKLAS